jgi:hypothetical protein
MAQPETDCWLIDLPYACYWIEKVEWTITKAPPIAKWMVGKDFQQVRMWVIRKGGTIEKVR